MPASAAHETKFWNPRAHSLGASLNSDALLSSPRLGVVPPPSHHALSSFSGVCVCIFFVFVLQSVLELLLDNHFCGRRCCCCA